MPEKGVKFLSREEVLTYEELEKIVSIFTGLGVKKVRITGGEPFARRNCIQFLENIKRNRDLESLCVTTNGVATSRHIRQLKEIGISGINISLDTLDRRRFWALSRRDELDQVLKTLKKALTFNIPLKINSVVLPDSSDNDLLQLGSLAEQYPISLRFIELMPFDGTDDCSIKKQEVPLFARLHRIFPQMQALEALPGSTARIFGIPKYRGTIGLIEGESRKFCGTCNKVRITAEGMLKNCLYDHGVLDLKTLLRSGATKEQVRQKVVEVISRRHLNGHETERAATYIGGQSMATIGG